MKEKIIDILKREIDPSIRFEVLERFYHQVDSPEDVKFVIEILKHDNDPCVRHEAAAQLFRIEEKKPHLMADIKSDVEEALLDRAFNDESTVVRHESIEALGYVGSRYSIESLTTLSEDSNLDIRSTAEIALKTALRRIEGNIKANELSDSLINNWVLQ